MVGPYFILSFKHTSLEISFLAVYVNHTVGAVAGMSMMLWKSPSTALYTAVKAIEVSVTDRPTN